MGQRYIVNYRFASLSGDRVFVGVSCGASGGMWIPHPFTMVRRGTWSRQAASERRRHHQTQPLARRTHRRRRGDGSRSLRAPGPRARPRGRRRIRRPARRCRERPHRRRRRDRLPRRGAAAVAARAAGRGRHRRRGRRQHAGVRRSARRCRVSSTACSATPSPRSRSSASCSATTPSAGSPTRWPAPSTVHSAASPRVPASSFRPSSSRLPPDPRIRPADAGAVPGIRRHRRTASCSRSHRRPRCDRGRRRELAIRRVRERPGRLHAHLRSHRERPAWWPCCSGARRRSPPFLLRGTPAP